MTETESTMLRTLMIITFEMVTWFNTKITNNQISKEKVYLVQNSKNKELTFERQHVGTGINEITGPNYIQLARGIKNDL